MVKVAVSGLFFFLAFIALSQDRRIVKLLVKLILVSHYFNNNKIR